MAAGGLARRRRDRRLGLDQATGARSSGGRPAAAGASGRRFRLVRGGGRRAPARGRGPRRQPRCDRWRSSAAVSPTNRRHRGSGTTRAILEHLDEPAVPDGLPAGHDGRGSRPCGARRGPPGRLRSLTCHRGELRAGHGRVAVPAGARLRRDRTGRLLRVVRARLDRRGERTGLLEPVGTHSDHRRPRPGPRRLPPCPAPAPRDRGDESLVGSRGTPPTQSRACCTNRSAFAS